VARKANWRGPALEAGVLTLLLLGLCSADGIDVAQLIAAKHNGGVPDVQGTSFILAAWAHTK
jgi:hypothetical protein